MIVGSTTLITLTAGNNALITGNERRCTLLFLQSSSQTGTVDVANIPMTAAGQGFSLKSVNSLSPMSENDYGALIKAPWYAWASHTGDTVLVIEGFVA